jgi:hypothetical protein
MVLFVMIQRTLVCQAASNWNVKLKASQMLLVVEL